MRPATMKAKQLCEILVRSLQSADVGGDCGDLLWRQIMRDRLHDRRRIRFIGLLAALLLPIGQLPDDIIAKLSGELRELAVALGLCAMA